MKIVLYEHNFCDSNFKLEVVFTYYDFSKHLMDLEHDF